MLIPHEQKFEGHYHEPLYQVTVVLHTLHFTDLSPTGTDAL